jgi:hemoglobin
MGGAPAIDAAVDQFYRRVLSDAMLIPFFHQTDLKRLKAHQRAFLTMALRGHGSYNGRTMRAAHQGRGITDAHFNRVAAHLNETLLALGVPAALADQVIGLAASLRGDIVDDATTDKAA